MRKLFAAVALIALACSRESAGPVKKKVNVHTNVIPTDASNVKVKEVLPMEHQVLDRAALGTKLDKDGNVFQSTETFHVGEPVYVTMWLKESPGGLQTSVQFMDAKGKQLAWPKKEMNGAKVATFKLDTATLPPGEYKAQCYWGMNIEHEYEFRIEGGKRKR